MLELQNVEAHYGRAQVLFGVSLRVQPGEVVALLGRNGAGKSTTLKTVMGLVRASSGRVLLEGRRIEALDPFEIARLGVGYVPEDRRLFSDLTVAENLEVARRAAREGLPAWTPERLFRLFPALAPMRERAAGRMSGGEQQMLTIARTLMGNPRLLLLDEPSEGLAPLVIDEIARAIGELKGAGIGVLLSEQNLAFAERVSSRAYLLAQGHIRREGAVGEMRDNLFS